jgi:hypothetical protein
MPTCYAFSCPTKCNGYWTGCRNYGCVDYAPKPVQNTIVDGDGVCGSHKVTGICTSVTWSRWIEVAGVENGSYYNSLSCGANRAYREATGGSGADAGLAKLDDHVYDLRDAINEERRRRDQATGSSLGNYNWVIDNLGGSQEIDNQVINEMVTAVNQIQANRITDVNPGDGSVVDNYHIDRIRVRLEGLKKACISNKTCSPNTVCSCYCHCNCHYSDRRLKKNIRSL